MYVFKKVCQPLLLEKSTFPLTDITFGRVPSPDAFNRTNM